MKLLPGQLSLLGLVVSLFISFSLPASAPSGLRVESNIGQYAMGAKYVMRAGAYQLAFYPTHIDLHYKENTLDMQSIRISFVGSQIAKLVPEGQMKTKLGYFNGPEPESWYENVPAYHSLRYKDLYPGIDLVFYNNGEGYVEFDFALSPDADPGQIALETSTGKDVRITADGHVELVKGLMFKAPLVYQDINGTREEVEGNYKLSKNGRVGFEIGAYQKDLPLIIDPVILYSSYFGGPGSKEDVRDMAVDQDGSVYITGVSKFSGQFYVAKFKPGASEFDLLQWFGTGNFDTQPRHILLDDDNNIIVDVTTRDAGMPVKNAFQHDFGGVHDIFLLKLKQDGELVFSTYIGGATDFPNFDERNLRGREYSSGLIVDKDNNIFLSGETDGSGFPTTPNALHRENIGNWDLFLMKISPNGGLLYSSFLGGSENDRIDTGDRAEEVLAIDSSGLVFFSGYTMNPLDDFPGSAGALDDVFTGSNKHVLCIFNSNTSSFVYSTFLHQFEPDFLKVDSEDRIHLAGHGMWPSLVNPIASEGGQFAVVLDPLLNVVFSSYIPCVNCDIEDIYVGTDNNMYFAAYDFDPGSIVSDSLPEFSRLKFNTYLGQIDVDNAEMVFSLVIGGNDNDRPQAIVVSDDLSTLYLAGDTRSTDFFTSDDAFTPSYQGDGDVFLTLLELDVKKADAIYLDANPKFISTGSLGFGTVDNIREITDVKELINAVRQVRDAVACDGVSEILIKFPFPAKVTIAEWKIEKELGTIETPWSNSTHEIDDQHYFLALYKPPDEFPEDQDKFRKDGVEATTISFQLEIVTSGGDQTLDFDIDLVRPPVVLVHGTFDNPENCWKTPIVPAANTMVQTLELAGFKVFTVNYIGTNGKINDFLFLPEAKEASRFKNNKRVVYENMGGIEDAIDYFRDELNVAATQADVIGHSMGGVLPRVYASHDGYKTEYKRTDNFMEGDINRLISIASTHSGSELSDFLGFIGGEGLLSGIPFIEAFVNEAIVFSTYLFGGIGDTGAVQDQRPSSPALKQIGQTDVPSHAIVCTVDDQQDLLANAGEPAEFATYYNFLRALTIIFYFNNATLTDFIINLADRHKRLPNELKNANLKSSPFDPIAIEQVEELLRPSNREEALEKFNVPLNRMWFVWHLLMDNVKEDWFTTEEGVVVTQYETTEINYGDFDDNLQTQIQNEDWSLIRGEEVEPFPSETASPDEVTDFFRYLIFKNAANDCVVRYESQAAGLAEPYITVFDNHIHSYAPRYPEIINRCVILLKSGNMFFADSLPPAGAAMPIEIPDPTKVDPKSVVDENTYTGCEAACWSGMVPSHAFTYAEVADALNMVILARPVNPDATEVIRNNNATKPMNLKGKSSNWGPQRAFIAQDQRFSKLWFQYEENRSDERDSEVIKYNEEVVKSLNDPAGIAILRHLEKAYTCDGNVQEYKVYFDSVAIDPVAAIYIQDASGQYFNWIKSVDDGCKDKVDCCPLSMNPVIPQNLKPMLVLANPMLLDDEGRPRFYTADYDLLAMAFYARSLDGLEDDPYTEAPFGDEKFIPRFTAADFDSEKGYITPDQDAVVDIINNEIRFETGYEGGNVTHHGPENQYYIVGKPKKGSPYVDYPITAFEPDFSRFAKTGIIRSIPKGPPGFRDRYLKRYMAKMRRKGYNLYPNLVANGWQWDYPERYTYEKGWDDRDVPGLDSGPEEIPFPDNCACIEEGNGLQEIPTDLSSQIREETSLLNLYPNPTSQVFRVTMYNPVDQMMHYVVFDLSGRQMREADVYLTKGIGTLTVDIGDLNPGMYVIRLTGENSRSTSLKFVKNSTK